MSAIEQLLRVQETDSRIRDLENEMRDIPARKTEEELRLHEHREALEQGEQDLMGVKARVKEQEVEVESRREKIGKLRTQQMELKTNKEFAAMDVEIKAVEREIKGLEDEELVLMEEQEAAMQEIDSRKRLLQEEEALVASDVQNWDKRVTEIEGELVGLKEERSRRVEGVDPELLKRYESIFSRKRVALVSIEGGVCGGCHLKLPPYIIHSARKQLEMVVCDFCGRLLH
ncbi:MAG: hypothetical protein HQ559_09525 [Lentisphaerae bacterium]|nr:hypothetical protein [Lentisphaerota bacterium]